MLFPFYVKIKTLPSSLLISQFQENCEEEMESVAISHEHPLPTVVCIYICVCISTNKRVWE